MRRVEVLCGDKLRVCVRLFELRIDLQANDADWERKVGEFEAGTLVEAIRGAVDMARNANG